MKVSFINPFIASLTNVLETMAQVKFQAGKPFLKEDDHPLGDVTGFIRMEGEQSVCTLAVMFSEQAILHIGTQMLGEPMTKLDQEAADLVGEITNMVTGGTKKLLWEQGYDFELSQPELHLGHDFKIEHINPQQVLVVPFTSDHGEFYLEACMRDNRVKANPEQFAKSS